MPQLVEELSQGNTFSRSAEGGGLADSATRVWKVILSEPDEALDIFSAIGVNIGDVYSQADPIPCVSIEGRADGESRLVRIITAQYRTTAGDSGNQNSPDPKASAPDSRLATVAVNTSYVEMPAWTWFPNPSSQPTTMAIAANPVGDMYDGITRYEPVVTFQFEQFESADPSGKLQHVGKVNSNSGSFGNLSLSPRSTLFRACNFRMHVESWGGTLYRGYTVSYEFAYRKNVQFVSGALASIGWDIAVPQTGFNVRAFTPNFVQITNDNYGQPLDHGGEGSSFYGRIVEPLALPPGISPGDRVRAHVRVFSSKSGTSQTPSAQPIALNDDGTPRAESADPKVLVYRRGQHEQFDFTTLGLRLPI